MRGEAMAETRSRIVSATLGLYREAGIDAATVPAVARAADVAPATVRNHFPRPSDLAEAAAAAILAELGMPDARIFDGVDGPVAGVERLVRELSVFYERGNDWWLVRERDRERGNAWAAPEAAYQAELRGLVATALGPLADDGVATAVVITVIEPLYFALRGAGSAPAAAVDVQLSIVVPWLAERVSGANPSSVPTSRHGSGAATRASR